jgi:potassium efflux system protein
MKLWVNHFMQKLFRAPFYVALLLALMFSPLLASAAPDDSSDQDQTAETTKPVDAPAALGSLQKRLDTIKQQVSTAKNDKSLSGLSDDALKLGSDADALGTALQPLRAQVQAKLDVLGPAPATGALPETPQVIKQRKDQRQQSGRANWRSASRCAENSAGAEYRQHFWQQLLVGADVANRR